MTVRSENGQCRKINEISFTQSFLKFKGMD